jgi:hypothetical protein
MRGRTSTSSRPSGRIVRVAGITTPGTCTDFPGRSRDMRSLWARTCGSDLLLRDLEPVCRAKATHHAWDGHHLYVLLQVDTQVPGVSSQTFLKVVVLDVRGGGGASSWKFSCLEWRRRTRSGPIRDVAGSPGRTTS